MKRIFMAAAGLAMTLSCAATAAPPVADAAVPYPVTASRYSTNWAGYYAVGTKRAPVNRHVTLAVHVKVPTVRCAGTSKGRSAVSMWAGIGGIGKGVSLEQAGILAECASAASKPHYYPFWEVFPALTTQFWRNRHGGMATVKAGDRLYFFVIGPSAPESQKRGYWTLAVDDLGPRGTGLRGWHKYYKLRKGVNFGNTAEVITEWPIAKDLGLADPGTVHYTYADYWWQYPDVGVPLSPVTQHKSTLRRNGKIFIYPGPPTKGGTPGVLDDFATYTNKL